MKGLGILINALAIFVAGGIGVIFRGKLKASFQRFSLEVLGVAVIILSVYNAWDAFFVVSEGQFELTGGLLVAFSLLVGAVFGDALRVDRLVDRLGSVFQKINQRAENKETAKTNEASVEETTVTAEERIPPTYDKSFGSRVRKFFSIPPKGTYPPLSELPTYDIATRSGSLFLDGFSLGTLLLCCSAMNLSGPLAEAAAGDSTILLLKSAVDFILIFVLATVYGNGVTFAALPMLVIQAGVFLIGLFKSSLLTPALVDQISLVGSVMLLGVGINLAFGKRLRVANLAPALLIPPVYTLIITLFQKSAEK